MADNPFTGLELRAELLDYVKPDGSYNLAEIELVLKQRIKDLTKQYHADKVEKGKHEEIQRAIATAKDALRDLPKPELEAYIAKLLEGDTGLVETAMGELAKSQEERNLLQKDLNEANKFLARAIDETLTPEEKRRYAGGANPEEIKKHVKVYITVFAALAFLTVLTVAASYLKLPLVPAILVALFIASLKAG